MVAPIVFAVLLVPIIIVSNVIEFMDYNHGVCPKCGEELMYFGNSDRSRLYVCPRCEYYTHVSRRWIDMGRRKKK